MAESADVKPEVNLVIVELHHHSQLLKNLYDILSLGHFRVTLITLPQIYAKTGIDLEAGSGFMTVCLKPGKESIPDFLQRLKPEFEAADVVYFNTVRHYWGALNKIPLPPVSIVRTHNVHCDLAPSTHLYRPAANSFSVLRHLIGSVLIGGEWRLKKAFYDRIGYFMFPNQPITDYVREKKFVDQRKILEPVVPFGYLGEPVHESAPPEEGCVTIAVTGTVTNQKKDYDLLFNALKQCLNDLEHPIKLVFLGSTNANDGKSIVNRFRSLESDSFSLDYSEGYISSEAFERKVASADFFVAPIQTVVRCRKYYEVYGKSKMSGVENDILVFRKPSLVISDYPVGREMEKVVDYFERTEDSLALQISKWVNDRVFDERKAAFDTMTGYRKEVIADRFYQLCRQLCG
ncbi:MAG: hypothetical protein R3296_10050 [Oleiphilaceae bacterium]|nr:hypothetical protein [Oleiphilaceae bacterium]